MLRGRRIYDEEGNLKKGQLRDFDEARRLREEEQREWMRCNMVVPLATYEVDIG